MTTFSFDQIIDRRGTDSMKWRAFPPDVLPLYAADMDFPSPPAIAEALHARIDHGFFGYPVESAELRELFVERLGRLYGWRVAPGELLFTPRVAEGVITSCRAVSPAGDDLLLPTPIYAFLRLLTDAGYHCVQTPLAVRTDGQAELDLDALEAAITPRTRVIFFCNPHNPVGRAYARAELERLAEMCLRRKLVICSDEVYSDLVFAGSRHIPIASLAPEVAQQTLTVMSPGKTYNVAGLRCAMVIAQNPALRQRFQAVVAGTASEVSLLGYVGALAAYRGGDEWLAQVLRYLEANRDFLVDYVRERLPGISMARPEATFVAWLDCRRAGIAGNASEFFLREARVAVNDGVLFGAGGEGFVRLVFGSPRAILAEGLDRMRAALARPR